MAPENKKEMSKTKKNKDIGRFIFVLGSIFAGPVLYETFSIPVNLLIVFVTYFLLMSVIGLLTKEWTNKKSPFSGRFFISRTLGKGTTSLKLQGRQRYYMPRPHLPHLQDLLHYLKYRNLLLLQHQLDMNRHHHKLQVVPRYFFQWIQ